MSEAKALLTKALELIRDPDHWTQGQFARDAAGQKVSINSPSATCFCSIGAVLVLAPPTSLEDEALLLLEAQLTTSIATFNDTHTHAEVIAVWERAIL
ncbi:DUF6197 family protein [Rhizobium arsenicireducens]